MGVFVGIDRRTGQYMLPDGAGLKLARTVMRMPAADKWSKDALSSISATPYSLYTPREPEIVFRDATDAQRPQLDPKVALSRQVYIKPADIERFGLTRGCPKCDHELNYGPGRTSKGHSKVCRDRIMGEMSNTAAST